MIIPGYNIVTALAMTRTVRVIRYESYDMNDFLDNINNGSIIDMIIIVFGRWHFSRFRIRFGV